LLVSRQATFEEVIATLIKKHTTIPPEVQDRIRLFDVRNHKDYKEFQLSQALSTASVDTSYGTNFYAEPIPQEEDEAGEQDKFIIVVHFSKDFTRHHGVPVKFLIKPVSLPSKLC
jgi:ubiquitin carboxyl-terminal hydrolase 7